MPRDCGKPYEHRVAAESGERLSMLLHDFDWADQVRTSRSRALPQAGAARRPEPAAAARRRAVEADRRGARAIDADRRTNGGYPRLVAALRPAGPRPRRAAVPEIDLKAWLALD